MEDKLKLLKQLREQGKITDDMYKSNLVKLIGNPEVEKEAIPTGMNWRETRDYNKILEGRAKNNAVNLLEGKSIQNAGKGTPFNVLDDVQSDNLKNALETIKAKQGIVQNLENTVKSTGTDMIGINPDIVQKSRFPSVKLKMDATGQEIGEGVAPSILKNAKGFAGVAPMLGMGAAALGVMPIAKKLQDQDWAGAVGDTAELGANIAFPIASTVLNSPELGAADIPDEEMRERNIYNAARQKGVSQPSNQEPLLQPEEDPNRAKAADLQETISKFKNTMGRIN